MGAAAARAWRAREGERRRRIFSGESAGHFNARHAAAKIEGQPFRKAHLSFFQDGFDEPRGAGIGTRRRAGRRGGSGRRTDRRQGPRGTHVAIGSRGGNLRDAAFAAAAGPGAGPATNDDGGTFSARSYRSTNGTRNRPQVAK